MNLQEAVNHLNLYGYCVIEEAISAARADKMAETYFRLHQDPANHAWFQDAPDSPYQTLFGLMNLDEMCWECAAHPHVLGVIHHLLGTNARIGEACSKWVKPGAKAGGVHVDSSKDLPATLPPDPWMINTMWMITDFTAENGATLVAPFSHRARQRPPRGMDPADKHMMPVTGRRGSVFLWHGGIWHANGANITTDQHRMGLNIAYYPPWWNLAREGGHQPIQPDVFARMPEALQKLNQHKVGKVRTELYDSP